MLSKPLSFPVLILYFTTFLHNIGSVIGTFAFALFVLFGLIAFKLTQVPYSPEVCRMLLDVIGTHAIHRLAAIVLTIYENYLICYFVNLSDIFLLVLAKPNYHILHEKCNAYHMCVHFSVTITTVCLL